MTGKSNQIVIFGLGEMAELAKYFFTHDSPYEVVAFSADDQFVKESTFDGLPVVPFSALAKEYPPDQYRGFVALSSNKLNLLRQQKYEAMKAEGYELVSYICTKSVSWPDLTVGDNCFILENQTIQPAVTVGNNVTIWSGNHLGHGCQIHDHVFITSHVCISGHTIIGERSFLGVNSTFKDFIAVGKRVFVAMDASVVKDIPDDSVILGAKSSVLLPGDPLGEKIRKGYFNL